MSLVYRNTGINRYENALNLQVTYIVSTVSLLDIFDIFCWV